jgi:hypothetical protein
MPHPLRYGASVFKVVSERPVILISECRAVGDGAITTCTYSKCLRFDADGSSRARTHDLPFAKREHYHKATSTGLYDYKVNVNFAECCQSMIALIDWLIIDNYIPLRDFSLTWRRHYCTWRAAKFRPMLGAQGLWAGRSLYRYTPAGTRDLVFFSVS